MVDLLQALLGITVPPIAVCVLLLLWPALTLRSLFLRLVRSVFEENLRGKIVLITGASSSLGQVHPPPSLATIRLIQRLILPRVCFSVQGFNDRVLVRVDLSIFSEFSV